MELLKRRSKNLLLLLLVVAFALTGISVPASAADGDTGGEEYLIVLYHSDAQWLQNLDYSGETPEGYDKAYFADAKMLGVYKSENGAITEAIKDKTIDNSNVRDLTSITGFTKLDKVSDITSAEGATLYCLAGGGSGMDFELQDPAGNGLQYNEDYTCDWRNTVSISETEDNTSIGNDYHYFYKIENVTKVENSMVVNTWKNKSGIYNDFSSGQNTWNNYTSGNSIVLDGGTHNKVIADFGGGVVHRVVVYRPTVAINEQTNVEYRTLQAALDAAKDKQTVRLLKDVTENVTFANDGTSSEELSVTLDLAGHGITGAPNGGSVIFIKGGTLTVADSKPTEGTHKYSFDETGLAVLNENGENSFTGGYITGGTGAPDQGSNEEKRGGGICIATDEYNDYSKGVFNMTGGTVIGNTAEFGGGFFGGQSPWANQEGTVPVPSEISNAAFIGNTALSGGGIYLAKGSMTAKDTVIEKNIAYGEENENEGDGGGVHFWGSGSEIVAFDNVSMTGNKANTSGGGIYFASDVSDIEMKTCTVAKNDAKYGGGGYFASATVPIENTTFTGNTAVNGGAIYGDSSTILLKDADCQITGNTADYGGAIFMSRGTVAPYAGSITGNTAAKAGGGIYCGPENEYSRVTISPQGNPVIADNVSGESKAADNVYLNANCYVGNYGYYDEYDEWQTAPPKMTSGASIGITLNTEEGDGRFTDIADETLAASIKQYFSADDSVRLSVNQGDLKGEDTDELYLVMKEIKVVGPAYITKDGDKVTSETEIKAGDVLKANVKEGTRLTYTWYHADGEGQPTGEAIGTGKSYTVKVTDIDEKLVVVVSQEGSDDLTSEPTPKVKGLLMIHNLHELEEFQTNVNGGYDYSDKKVRLMADIDMSEKYSAEGASWTPIGTSSNPYKGCFEGNGHSITGIYIDDPDDKNAAYTGLFGKASKATIKDLTVSGHIMSYTEQYSAYTGMLLGYGDGVNLEGCNVTDSEVISSKTAMYVGGLVGFLSTSGWGDNAIYSSIKDCSVETDVTGARNVGGIAGYTSDVLISDCSHAGNVTANTIVGGGVGGIVGNAGRNNNKDAEIRNCTNTGKVTGSTVVENQGSSASLYLGGIAGYSYLDLTNGYNEATVELAKYEAGTPSNNIAKVGGLVGQMNSGNVEHCYNSGDVTDASNTVKEVRIGGLIGSYEYSGSAEAKVLNNYNAGNVSISTSHETTNVDYYYSSAGGLVGAVTNTGNTTAFTNCHSFGTVSKTADVKTDLVHGIVGNNRSTSNSFNSIYYNIASPEDSKGIPLGNDAFKVKKIFTDAGWDFDKVWDMGAKHPVFVTHKHSFVYAAGTGEAANTITATCNADGCTEPPATATLTLKKPTMTTYGQTGQGISASATLDGTDDFNSLTGKSVSTSDIKYVGRDGTSYQESTTAPADAGKYTAKITLGEGDTAVTATVDYEIAKAAGSISYSTGNVTKTYGEAAFTNELTKTGDGTVTYESNNLQVATVDSFTGEVTIIGAGVATITAKVTDSTNYAYATKSASYALTVNPATMTVSAAGYTGTYDETAHSITVMTTKPTTGATITYGTTEGTYDLDENPQIINVNDSKTVYFKVTAPNYADYTGSAAVTLSKADQDAPAAPTEATATINSVTLNTIENGEYSMDGTNWQESTTFSGLNMNTSYTFYQRTKGDDNHNTSPASTVANISTANHVHQWGYQAEGAVITATCANTDGGHGTPLTTTLTLKAPTLETYGQEGEGVSASATLDGTDNFNSLTGKSISTSDIKYVGRDGTSYQENSNAPTDAGKYTAKITVEGATATVNYEIAKANLTNVSVMQDGTLTYTGDDLTPQVTTAATAKGNQTVTFTYSTTVGGVYGDMPTVTTVSDSGTIYFKASAPNHNDYLGSFTVTVNKANQEAPAAPTAEATTISSVTLNTIENGEYSMDGTNWQESATFTGLDMNTSYTFYQRKKADDNHNASPASPLANISTANHAHQWGYQAEGAVITATCANTDGGHGTPLTATLTIKAPTLTTYGQTGQGISAEATIEGSIDGVQNPTIVYKKGTETLDAAPTDAGTYTASITLGEGDKAATATVEYTIAAKQVTVSGIVAEDKIYDGNMTATLDFKDVVISGLKEGDALSVKATGAFVNANAGQGKTVNLSGLTLDGDSKANYVLASTGQQTTTTATIEPKSISGATVTLDHYQLTYNGGSQSVIVTGVTIDEMTLTPSDYDVSGNSGTDKNDYTVTVTGKGNFKDAATVGWKIVEKAMTVKAENVTVPYDGKEHGITVEVTDPASGVEIRYGTEEGTYDLETSPTIKEVGTLTVYYKVTDGPNYSDYTGTAIVTIEKAATTSATVTANDRTADGTTKPLVNVDESTLKGGKMMYAIGKDGKTAPTGGWSKEIPTASEAGTYYVWHKVVGDENYSDSEPVCTTVDIKETPAPDENVYSIPVSNEKDSRVTAKIDGTNATIGEITQKDIDGIIGGGGQSKMDTIKIDLLGVPRTIKSVVLSKSTLKVLQKAVSDNNGVSKVEIALTKASVTLDEKAMKALVVKTKDFPIKLVVRYIQTSRLNKNQKKTLRKHSFVKPFEAFFESNGKRISDFDGGTARVSLDFTPAEGTQTKYYHVVYLRSNGMETFYKTSYKNGRMWTTLDYFSDEYAIVYDTRIDNEKPDEPVQPKSAKKGTRGILLAKMTPKGKKSLDITWTKISGAAGYDVFFSRCNHDNKVFVVKKVKSLKGANTLKWTHKGLKKHTPYKAVVKAYVVKNGKKTYVATSPGVHSYTAGSGKKFTNPKSVKVNKTKVTLAKGKTFKLKASVKKLKKSKKLISKNHTDKLRYCSNNTKVATVTKNGKIKAKAKGNCKIYVLAANGVRTAVSVNVK